MATGKNSFLFYKDWKEIFDSLETKEEKGELIDHILNYVNDKDPEPLTGVLRMAFVPIKLALKRDLKSWESTKLFRSEAGKKGAQAKQAKGNKAKQNKQKVTKQAVSVSVTDSVSVSDAVIESDTEIKMLPLPFSSLEFLENWNLLLSQKKWKKKSVIALNASIKKLSRVDELSAIKMLENAIAGEWQGLHELEKNSMQKNSSVVSKVSAHQKVKQKIAAKYE